MLQSIDSAANAIGTSAAQAAAEAVYEDDQLVRAPEVRRRCGNISIKTFQRWRKDHGFPAPEMTVANTDYWKWQTVREWIAAQGTEAA